MFIFLTTIMLIASHNRISGVFTIESSQNALGLLKSAHEKIVESLRYMLLSIKDYKSIFYEQEEAWSLFEIALKKTPEEMKQLVLKIKTLEKSNENYELLLNRLFEMLNKMEEGIDIYSEYMTNIDNQIKLLLKKQEEALVEANKYMRFCD